MKEDKNTPADAATGRAKEGYALRSVSGELIRFILEEGLIDFHPTDMDGEPIEAGIQVYIPGNAPEMVEAFLVDKVLSF